MNRIKKAFDVLRSDCNNKLIINDMLGVLEEEIRQLNEGIAHINEAGWQCEARLEQKDKEIESLKGLEDHLNKRDKINREEIEKLERVVKQIARGEYRQGVNFPQFDFANRIAKEALNQLNDGQRIKENDDE